MGPARTRGHVAPEPLGSVSSKGSLFHLCLFLARVGTTPCRLARVHGAADKLWVCPRPRCDELRRECSRRTRWSRRKSEFIASVSTSLEADAAMLPGTFPESRVCRGVKSGLQLSTQWALTRPGAEGVMTGPDASRQSRTSPLSPRTPTRLGR